MLVLGLDLDEATAALLRHVHIEIDTIGIAVPMFDLIHQTCWQIGDARPVVHGHGEGGGRRMGP